VRKREAPLLVDRQGLLASPDANFAITGWKAADKAGQIAAGNLLMTLPSELKKCIKLLGAGERKPGRAQRCIPQDRLKMTYPLVTDLTERRYLVVVTRWCLDSRRRRSTNGKRIQSPIPTGRSTPDQRTFTPMIRHLATGLHRRLVE